MKLRYLPSYQDCNIFKTNMEKLFCSITCVRGLSYLIALAIHDSMLWGYSVLLECPVYISTISVPFFILEFACLLCS